MIEEVLKQRFAVVVATLSPTLRASRPELANSVASPSFDRLQAAITGASADTSSSAD